MFGPPPRSITGIVLRWTERIVLMVLLVLAFFRFVNWDGWALTAVVGAYTLYLFIPAYPIAVVSGLKGRWLVFAAALFLVLAHLAWVLPTINTSSSAAFISRDPDITIVSANVNGDNPEPDKLLRQLRSSHPEIITMVEYTPKWKAAVDRGNFRADFPFSVERVHAGVSGIAMFSTTPLGNPEVLDLAGRPMVRATTFIGGKAVTVYGVHMTAPGDNFEVYKRQFAELRRVIGDDPERVVVVGDFETTEFNRALAQLEGIGLHSAHEEAGRGLATTYPNGKGGVLSNLFKIRLDHAYLSHDLATIRIDEGKGSGSNHRPVIVELTTRPSEDDS